MEGDFIKINKKLLPLSWLYGLGVGLRNLLFEMNILKSRSFSTPVIAVGNITVGGTGKTPHVEYLAGLLSDRLHVAVLSRGYKRKTRGFVLADGDSTPRDIGDEPWQIKRKFPDMDVAVDAKRTRGIRRLTDGDHTEKSVDVILLDDAYQHRYVKPGISILLVDYHRQIIYDRLLPAGRLREPVRGKDRADIVIITKCPKDLKPMDYRVLTKQMSLYPYQQLFFTSLDYEVPRHIDSQQPLQPLHGQSDDSESNLEPGRTNAQEAHDAPIPLSALNGRNVLLLTGIASPSQMMLDLEPHALTTTSLAFGDHHTFKKKDIRRVNEAFAAMPEPKVIVTTEKDAARLLSVKGLSDEARERLYVLPVKITFMQQGQETFNDKIIDYVRKNSRNSILAQGKDADKSKDGHRTGDRPGTIVFRNNG